MPEVIKNEDGSITVPVRGPDGISTVTITVDDVRRENNEMWQWVMSELKSIIFMNDEVARMQATCDLYERMQRL